ncbi:MAG TPA: uracil-DNA glycosylase family protein, partial [Steroidobacteraceae bacterium]
MASPLRDAYLDALGIDRWVSRNAPPEPEAQAPAPALAIPAPPVQATQSVPLGPITDWGVLRQRVAACTACDLCKTRTQTVFGVGNTRADWLVIGEAPGAEEDRQGEPFVGRAGQ